MMMMVVVMLNECEGGNTKEAEGWTPAGSAYTYFYIQTVIIIIVVVMIIIIQVQNILACIYGRSLPNLIMRQLLKLVNLCQVRFSLEYTNPKLVKSPIKKKCFLRRGLFLLGQVEKPEIEGIST